MLVVTSYGQVGIFGTAAAPQDTATMTNTTAKTSYLIKYNAYPQGVATLYMAADTITGNPQGVAGEWRIWHGKNTMNQDMYGQWHAISDSVLLAADFNTSGTLQESDAVGRDINLADQTGWGLGLGIELRFTGVGTHTSLVLGYLLFY
jgi:hypothetical protein